MMPHQRAAGPAGVPGFPISRFPLPASSPLTRPPSPPSLPDPFLKQIGTVTALPFTHHLPRGQCHSWTWDCLPLVQSLLPHEDSMGPKGHALREPTPSSRSCSRYLHLRILCPNILKLTPRVCCTGLFPGLCTQDRPRHWPRDGDPRAAGGCRRRSDIGLGYPHACTQRPSLCEAELE